MVYSKHALFHVDTPLRCASLLTNFMPGESHPTDQPTYLAVGSNLKHIHLLSYRRRELLEDARASNASLTSLVDSTGLVRLEQTYENCHKGSVYCMDWMPAYRLLASGSNDKMVKLWRANGSAGSSLKGHNGTVRALRFRNPSQPSGEVLLASCGAGDFRPRIWDAAAG
jgi:WD40 repeat protein